MNNQRWDLAKDTKYSKPFVTKFNPCNIIMFNPLNSGSI